MKSLSFTIVVTIPKKKKKIHSPFTLLSLMTTSLTLMREGPGVLGTVWVLLGIQQWIHGYMVSPPIIAPIVVATKKKNQFKYYQQFINRHLHSEIYTSFTHYFHLPCPIDLVVTWCHHFFFAAHPHAACPCATHPHAACPCAAFPGAAPLLGDCSPSSWLKNIRHKRVTYTSTHYRYKR